MLPVGCNDDPETVVIADSLGTCPVVALCGAGHGSNWQLPYLVHGDLAEDLVTRSLLSLEKTAGLFVGDEQAFGRIPS
jgi:hypothetical protein